MQFFGIKTNIGGLDLACFAFAYIEVFLARIFFDINGTFVRYQIESCLIFGFCS